MTKTLPSEITKDRALAELKKLEIPIDFDALIKDGI